MMYRNALLYFKRALDFLRETRSRDCFDGDSRVDSGEGDQLRQIGLFADAGDSRLRDRHNSRIH